VVAFLVGQHLGKGESRAVVNRDVDKLPTGRVAPNAGCLGAAGSVVAAPHEAPAGAALDAPQVLDVDVISSPGRPRS
jgi:hypothetical protein